MSVVHTLHVAVRLAAVATLVTVSGATADIGLYGVPDANTKVPGFVVPNVLSPELIEVVVAPGSTPLENFTVDIPYYGYNGDGPMLPAPGDTCSPSYSPVTHRNPRRHAALTTIAGRVRDRLV
jgi:hypothetical protein